MTEQEKLRKQLAKAKSALSAVDDVLNSDDMNKGYQQDIISICIILRDYKK